VRRWGHGVALSCAGACDSCDAAWPWPAAAFLCRSKHCASHRSGHSGWHGRRSRSSPSWPTWWPGRRSQGGLARARRLAPERLRQIARDAARVRWGGLPEMLKPIFWTHPTTFDSLRLDQDLDLILYQVLAYGDAQQRAWLVDRVGSDTVRAWLRKRRGGGVPADRLSEWFELGTIRRWQRNNPGATPLVTPRKVFRDASCVYDLPA